MQPYAPPQTNAARPNVIGLYRGYTLTIGIASFITLAVCGFWHFLAAASSPTAQFPEPFVPVFFVGCALSLLHLFAAFVPYKPWGWTVALIVISLGLPSCAVVAALPLLVFWTRPITKAAFRRV